MFLFVFHDFMKKYSLNVMTESGYAGTLIYTQNTDLNYRLCKKAERRLLSINKAVLPPVFLSYYFCFHFL